ncbi:MAG TPA: hypothetical protein VK158_01550 [Acidobacteriota bacterium]|nr:hypothetical protein [Acidobacteriota bacterium]
MTNVLEELVGDSRATQKGAGEFRRQQKMHSKYSAPLVTGKHPVNHTGHYRGKNAPKTYDSERLCTLKPLTTTQSLVSAIEKIAEGRHTRQNYASTEGINGERLALAQKFTEVGVAYEPAVIARLPLAAVIAYKRKPHTFSSQ